MTAVRTLRLELRSPVVVTADSATVGGHRTLTRIPGAQLLGAVAGALHLDPNAELPSDAYQILCSGNVRFGDAWPEHQQVPAFAAPLCLHFEKGETPGPGTRLFNLGRVERPENTQLVQLREHTMTPNAEVVAPARSHTLRTAIEERGRAREGLLFGVEALDAGQTFLARVEGEDERLLDTVVRLLCTDPIRIGRSRSAEFGEVRVTHVTDWDATPSESSEGEVVLWLCADLALRDLDTGMPRLQPRPADFGLPNDWEVDPGRTFIRVRRYSPFNGARLRPDLERQVIEAGSVVTFHGSSELDLERVRRTVAGGIGDYRVNGLGRMLVNPPLLRGDYVTLPRPTVEDHSEAPEPAGPLFLWLRQRQDHQRRALEREEQAQQIVGTLRDSRISNAQWGEVRRLARHARFSGGVQWLRGALEEFLDHGARQHIWPKKKRNALLGKLANGPDGLEGGVDVETIELAASWLARPDREQLT